MCILNSTTCSSKIIQLDYRKVKTLLHDVLVVPTCRKQEEYINEKKNIGPAVLARYI